MCVLSVPCPTTASSCNHVMLKGKLAGVSSRFYFFKPSKPRLEPFHPYGSLQQSRCWPPFGNSSTIFVLCAQQMGEIYCPPKGFVLLPHLQYDCVWQHPTQSSRCRRRSFEGSLVNCVAPVSHDQCHIWGWSGGGRYAACCSLIMFHKIFL